MTYKKKENWDYKINGNIPAKIIYNSISLFFENVFMEAFFFKVEQRSGFWRGKKYKIFINYFPFILREGL